MCMFLFLCVSIASDYEQATVTMATNFTGTLSVSRALFPLLRKGGRVVNMASVGHLTKLGADIQVSNEYTYN